MIPVTQTKVVVKNSEGQTVQNGNCYAAAIASILEVPITEVPNVEVFFKFENGPWQETMHAYLNLMGWELYCNDDFQVFHNERHGVDEETRAQMRISCEDKYYLVSGKSSRGVSHICIYKNGKLVHDPHPTREGLLTEEIFEELIKKQL